MADDWRLSITLDDDGRARDLVQVLHDREVHDELRDELGGRVAVSRDGATVFCYADTRRGADAAARVLGEVLAEQGATVEPRLDRWHPIEEAWEDAQVPLPGSEAERRAERERLDDADEAASIATGVAQWEVRLEVGSPGEAEALAAALEDDGRSVVRRARFLLVGANDRDDADELAASLEGRGTVQIEPSSGVAWQLLPRNPFAVFGGLGG
ncbi:MAG TPA: hypothetical protein VFI04_04615 [Gaiellaceae bacterium]|jgi:hypothetical protein|nr:hypothetical protein [Gaiellaceae bacterium]